MGAKVLIIPLIIGAVVLALGCILGFVVFPTLLEDEIIKNVVLEEDTLQWYRFLDIPFPINFKVHFFTIENPVETLDGEIPRVKEVGPYIYSERRKKVITSVEKDLVHYNELWTFEFNSEASGELKEDDMLTVVNAPMLAILQSLEDLPFPLPGDLDNILEDIFEDTKVFIPVKVKDYGYGGIKMCDPNRSTTGYSKLICLAIMIMNLKLMQYNEDLSMNFSLFGYKSKPDGPFALRRGIDNIEKLGLITGYKNQEYTKFWNGTKTSCDKVEGHYTTFPPFMEKDTSWQVYSTDICKGGILHYADKSTFKNVNGYRFQTDQYSFASPSEECVCVNATKGTDGQEHCFSKGVLDLNTCIGAPVVLSFPHMMWADEEYKKNIIGLRSDYTDDHNTIIDFEPHLGFPLRGAIRIQFNVVLRPIGYAGTGDITWTEKLPRTLFPIIWIEDSFELTDKLIEEVNADLLNNLILMAGVKWGLIALGIFILVITIGFCICRNSRKKLMN